MIASQHDLAERAGRLVGRVLREKWRLDALIGIGGMAAVYAATHRNGKRVAIKLLHPELSIDPGTKTRFLREGYVGNKVGHAGVVSVLDDDTSEEGSAFLVMDLLEGETLKTKWRRAHRRMDVDEVLRTTRAVLDVLVAAHDKGIVHRDLKPENVFLTSDGLVKVLDFGIARLREGSDGGDKTRTGAMLGTPAFMAPEQARSRWDWVDARTDLWAIGATMFTTLTGEFVHQAETATELLVAAATQRARPLRSIAPEVPTSVAAIVDRALEFDPAERWQDARAMQSAIGAVIRERAESTATIVMPTGASREPAAAPVPASISPETKPIRQTLKMSGQEPSPDPMPALSRASSSDLAGATMPSLPPHTSPIAQPFVDPGASSSTAYGLGGSSSDARMAPAAAPAAAPAPSWPAPAPMVESGGASAMMTTASGTSNTQSATPDSAARRSSARLLGVAAGAFALVLIAGIALVRGLGGAEPSSAAPSEPTAAPSVSAPTASAAAPSAPSSVEAAPAASERAPAESAAPSSEPAAPSSEPAAPASEGAVEPAPLASASKKPPKRSPPPPPPLKQTSKPKNPLDKY